MEHCPTSREDCAIKSLLYCGHLSDGKEEKKLVLQPAQFNAIKHVFCVRNMTTKTKQRKDEPENIKLNRFHLTIFLLCFVVHIFTQKATEDVLTARIEVNVTIVFGRAKLSSTNTLTYE